MKMILLFWALILTSLVLSSCKKNPVASDDNVQPGRRDYVWSIDSIDYDSIPGIIELNSIWGSSVNDIWGAGFTEDVRNCFWHYDGIKWSRAVWNTPITEYGNGSKSVGGVWGTAQNDVWAFGGRLFSNPERIEPFIMHFDGNQWTEVIGDKSQMPIGYTDIYAIRKDHFWISSSNHVSEYKDGSWKKYFIAENYFIQSIGGTSNNIFLTAYPIGTDSLYLMKFDGSRFYIIDKTTLITYGKFGYSGLLFANNKIYTFGRSIYSKKSNEGNLSGDDWIQELSLNIGGFYNSFIENSKDIWAIGINTFPYQFNGENWAQILIDNFDNSEESHFIGIWGNGNEIFICDTGNGIIYHGK
jgi:hypothetical protein